MILRVLGSAAGGGLPQWNCACANCVAARAGKIPSQTQSSVAFCGQDRQWWLINASPDLARQIEATPELQPSPDSPRNSPIAGVFLTNADVDHALGLLLLRQRETPLIVYATEQTRAALDWIDNVIARFCGIDWRNVGDAISVSAIELSNSTAFQLRDERSGAAALVAPAVGELTNELREAMQKSDVIFFDGTFWSENELRAFRPGTRTAREMHHLSISDGSLELLRNSPARRKIYIHINNTNPILMPGSPERRQVEEAGVEIGYDGLEIVL